MSDIARFKSPVLLAPLWLEAAALRHGASRCSVERIGFGPERAGRAARRLDLVLPAGQQVVVAGVAGGLRKGLLPGDLVVGSKLVPIVADGSVAPGESVELSGSADLASRLAALLRSICDPGRAPAVHHGPIGCARNILSGDTARSRAASNGLLAVEMESLWCADLRKGRGFAVLRVVLDTVGQDLLSLHTPLRMLAAYRSLALVSRSVVQLFPGSVACSPLEV